MRLAVHRPVLALFLALGTAYAPRLAAEPGAARLTVDYISLIGDFPQPGSCAAKADQAILLWLQRSRTQEDVRRAASEVGMDLGVFSAVTGKDLDSGNFPLTLALGMDLERDLRLTMAPVKKHFARPRPYESLAELHPAIPREASFSYPSGHAAWGAGEAALLAQLDPGPKEAVLERGRLVGYDRALGGVHCPSDVEAGQRMGAVFAEAWLAEPGHRQRLERARAAEWAGH